MAIERILSYDSGKIAFEKSDRNFTGLEQQINVLSGNLNGFKFYKDLKEINLSFTNQTDIATICAGMKVNSIALVDVGNNTALYPTNYGFVTIYKLSDSRCRLEFSSHSNGTIAFGTWHTSSGFTGWQQIATTTKTSFSCTAASGYTISEQVCYLLNGEFYISLKIAKSNGSVFVPNGRVVPATLPITVKGVVICNTMGKVGSEWQGVVNAYAHGGQLLVIPTSVNITEIYVTIKGGIA